MKLHLPKALFTAVIAAFAVSQTVWAGSWTADNCYTFTGSEDVTSIDGTVDNHTGTDGLFLRAGAEDVIATLTEVKQTADSTLIISGTKDSTTAHFDSLTIDSLVIGDGSGSCSLQVGNYLDNEAGTADSNVTIKAISGSISRLDMGSAGHLTIGVAGDKTSTYSIGAGNLAVGSTLTLAGGVTTLGTNGDQSFTPSAGELIVNSDATLMFADTDVLSWGKNLVTLNGGTWKVNGKRQSVGGGTILNLVGGSITDEGKTYGDGYGSLDMAGSGIVINSSGTSVIEGGVRVRGNNITINVTDGTLSLDTIVRQNNSSGAGILKKGDGTLKFTSMASSKNGEGFYVGDTVMEGGAIEYAMDTNASYGGTISGKGDILKSGAGKVTLANVSNLDGSISVSAGELEISALALNKTMGVSVTGGTLSVSDVTVNLDSWTPSSSGYKYYVYETQGEGDAATTVAVESATGNGFLADTSTYQLFDGYEWNGTIAGFSTSTSNGDTYITADGEVTTVYHITNGTVNMESVGLIANDKLTGYEVYNGAVLDIKGKDHEGLTVTLRGGATLANTGGDIGNVAGTNKQQVKSLRLKGNATVNAVGQMGVVAGSLAATTVDLAGHTLTKTGADNFLLMNTAISAGSIDIQQGTVKMYNQGSGGGLSVDDDVAVNIAQGANLNIVGDKDAIVDGDFILNSTGTGTINLHRDVNIGSNGGTSAFAGTISVNSNKLYLGNTGGGTNEMESIDLSQATIAMNGGTVRYFGGSSTIGTLSVKADGTFEMYATNNNAEQGILTMNTVSVDANKTLTISGSWDSNAKIGVLTGAGSIKISHAGNGKKYAIEAVDAGFGSITNASNLTLGTATTTVNLSSTITNTGTVTLLGALALTGDAFADRTILDAQYDNTGDAVADAGATDGYMVDAGSIRFSVVSGGSISSDGVTSLTYNGASFGTDALSVADNKLTFTMANTIEQAKAYYVNTTVDYSAGSTVASDATTGVVLNGGTLNLNTALNSNATDGIKAVQDSSIVIGDNVTLNNSSVSKDGGTATIAGGSTAVYSMGVVTTNATSATPNVAFGADWKGTVLIGADSAFNSTSFDIDAYANGSNSTVEIAGATGYLGHSDTIKNIDANIKLSGDGWKMTDGYSNAGYTFNGAFSGLGNWVVADITRDNAYFTFKGDMSQWSGAVQQNGGTGNGWTWNYEAAEGKNTTIGNSFKLNKAAGVMNINVTNAAAVEMTGEVIAEKGTIKLTKAGDSKLTVNSISANGGNVQLTGTGANAISVGNMSIAAANTVTGTADVTVTGTLSLGAEGTLALTGSLSLADGVTINLTGLTLEAGKTSYTLATATNGVNLQDYTITGLDLTGTSFEGYEMTISAVDPTATAGLMPLAEGSNTALVLTLTPNTPAVKPSLTEVNVASGAWDATNQVLTLATVEKLADFSGLGTTLNAVIDDEMWVQLTQTVGTLVDVSFKDAEGNIFDFDGVDGSTPVNVTLNGVGTNTVPTVYGNEGTVVGSYMTSYIPEPTSTTLSLLALAALAVRRRRK